MPVRLSARPLSFSGLRLQELSGFYHYPAGLDLEPTSEQHKKLLALIYDRLTESHNQMSMRYGAWNEIDKTLTAYIYTDDAENAVKLADARKPIATVVPLSYATMETLLTYLAAVYMDEPVFKYDYVGSEDAKGVALLELLISLQTRRYKAPLALHTIFRDNLAYGIGPSTPVWKVTNGTKSRNGFIEERVLFEGNQIKNINPYCYLPDVSVSAHEVQDGEYVGWVYTSSYSKLLARESTGDNTVFNVRYLENETARTSLVSGKESSATDRYGVGKKSTQSNPNLDVAVLYVDLIPEMWELGPGTRLEKWKFEVACDSIIISAMPMELDHNMFPVAICCTDYDGYTPSPLAGIEVTYGLQTAVDFLYNSHIANVRKSVNDMFIVDPDLININDMLHPEAGLLIRLRQKAWGRGVKDAVEQFKVQDVTRQNIDDISMITAITDRASGAVNSLSGMYMQQGERRSATEIRSTRGSALSRLEKKARLAGIQCIQDLAYMFAMHTQQFMTQETMVKIIGPMEQILQEEFGPAAIVGPSDIDVNFDVVPYDGSLPTSEDPELWIQMLQTSAGIPELLQTMDITKIFKHFARISGAKNVHEFVRRGGNVQAQVMPDEQVLREAEKGNIRPVEA